MAQRSPAAKAREERAAMGDALVLAHDWLANTLVEAPDSIEVSKDGVVSINYFLDDGPRIRSIIEGVGFPSGTKWECNRHGFFLNFDNSRVSIYTDDRSLHLPAHELLRAFSEEE